MVWTSYQFGAATVSLISCTGTIILMKAINRTESIASDDEVRVFHHPFFVVTLLFLGETCNLIYFYLIYTFLKSRHDGSEDRNKLTMGNRDLNPLFHSIPAMFDTISSIVQFIGLNLTYASSFQALKASVIIFTATFSIIFLKRKITLQHWTGIAITISGLVFVILGDHFSPRSTPKIYKTQDIIIGDILVVLAQVVTASQMVVEEVLVLKRDSQPLQSNGWQGIFGFPTMITFLVIAYFIPCPRPIAVNPRQTLEDALDALVQVSNSKTLIGLCAAFTFIVGLCKVAGINLTKEFSCVTRGVFDCLRIILLYTWGIIFFGQKLHYLHLLGFLFVISGVSLHNNVFGLNTARWIGRKCRCLEVPSEGEAGEDTTTEDTGKK